MWQPPQASPPASFVSGLAPQPPCCHCLAPYLWRNFVQLPNGTPFELRGLQPYQFRCFCCARLCVSCWGFGCWLIGCYGFLFYLLNNQGPPRIVLGAAWASKDHVGSILCTCDFSRNPKIEKLNLMNFPMTDFYEAWWNRCAIALQTFPSHWFI